MLFVLLSSVFRKNAYFAADFLCGKGLVSSLGRRER